MIPPNKMVHLFLMISEFILTIMTFVFFIFGIILKKNFAKIIWICSKIDTVNKILIDNIDKKPITSITLFPDCTFQNDTMNNSYRHFYSHIAKKKKCEVDYKMCGILDTYKNILCIPNDEECPINNIALYRKNSSSRKNDDTTYCENIEIKTDNMNSSNNIIVDFLFNFNNETMYYINKSNFIFDNNTFEEYYNKYSENDNIYGNTEVNNYINYRLSEQSNIDIYYKDVNNTFYYKNYIGFKNYKDMEFLIEETKKDDFKKLYKIDFPNLPSTILAIFSFCTLLVLIIVSLAKFLAKEKKKTVYIRYPELKSKLIISGIYLTIFLGYSIYLIYICCKINKKNKCFKLKKIKSDKFIEKHISDICDDIIEKSRLDISGIVLFPISFILFVIGLCFEQLYILWLKMKGKKLELQWIHLENRFKITA